MKRIHIIGIAFAAIFAFSMVGASGASALSLWDHCTQTAPVLEFTEISCMTKGAGPTWGWEEIKAKTSVNSLVTTLTLSSNGTTIDCKGSMVGTVGPGAEDEVLELLNEAGEVITEAKPVECELLQAGLCTAPVLATPQGLPWKTELTGNNDLLEDGTWLITCNNGVTNLCSRVASLLTVENVLPQLEVGLGFKPLEEATCTIGKGTV